MLKNSIRSRVCCDHLDDRVVFIKLIQVTVCQMLSVWFVETYRFIEKKVFIVSLPFQQLPN